MKAKAIIVALAASCCLTAYAQEEAPTTQNKPGMYTTFARDKASDHWFIDLMGGGGVQLFSTNNNHKNFLDRVSITPTLAIGKWHEPYFATRIQFMGWDMKGYVDAFKMGNNGKPEAVDGGLLVHNYYGVAHFDFMFDLNNYFGVYRPNKVFHVIPFVGIGAGYKYKAELDEVPAENIVDAEGNVVKNVAEDNTKSYPNEKVPVKENVVRPTIHGGVMFKFRLGKRVDLNLEGQMMMGHLYFVGRANPAKLSNVCGYATAGLTVNLGRTEWNEVVPMDWGLVKNLNDQINKLRTENEELSKRPVSCPECPEVPVAEEKSTIVNNVVYFRINSAKIRKDQEVNIYNTAEYAKKNNQKIYLVGYADKDTGTSAYNMKLSERRAKAVCDMLVNKFGVSADQIEMQWKGSDEQPYTENAWNRIVIMTAE